MENENVLRQAGWHELDSSEESIAFDDFTRMCCFSLHNEWKISPQGEMVEVDFNVANRGAETSLRRFVIRLFQSAFPESKCIAMDINHGMWSFEPRYLKLTDRFEPMPLDVLPWVEYVVLSDRKFENGIFCNPRKKHLVAYGKVLTDAFKQKFDKQIVIR